MKQSDVWPALPLAQWKDSYATLHMWTQIAGKIRLALCPPVNHFWATALYVSARGLTSSQIPYSNGVFEITFDFIAHTLEIETSHGEIRTFPLIPRTVAEFYSKLMDALHSLGIEVKVWPMPVEVPRPVRFDLDESHSSYDGEYAHRFWQILVSVDTVFREFRSRFIGKASPIHFFWGSFDREIVKDAAFYAYAVPEPAGFKEYRVLPDKAFYSKEKNEFFLMYDDVRLSANPEKVLLDFCQSSYEAAAILGNWDRANLER